MEYLEVLATAFLAGCTSKYLSLAAVVSGLTSKSHIS